jgi:hypothetical protein
MGMDLVDKVAAALPRSGFSEWRLAELPIEAGGR